MNATHTMQSLYRAALGVIFSAVFALSPTHAETLSCTAITSLPYTINSQGVYCFTGHLGTSMTSGNAITINVNNVTLDMNGYKLAGLGAGDGTETRGIYAYQRKNITIRNGIIRGFYYGIWLRDASPYTTSQGHVVRGILADQNTRIGIFVDGRGMSLRGNRVVDTGGSTLDNNSFGIAVHGPGNNVLDNQVSTTTATASDAYGIFLYSADNSMVKDNRLSETSSSSGSSYGISIGNSSDVIARNNLLSVADYGISYSGSTGLYGGNYTSNVSTPFSGGTAAGSSNYSNP